MHFTFAILLLCLAALTHAEESVVRSSNAERLFQKALSDYRDNLYAKAAQEFDSLARMSPMHHRTTVGHIMKAKSLLAQNKDLDAARTLKSFLTSFAWSTYRSDAFYMLGLAHAKIQRYDEAMTFWMDALGSRSGPTITLTKNTARAMERVAEDHFDTAELRVMIARSRKNDASGLLWMVVAEKEASFGNVTAASAALDSLELTPGSAAYATRIADLRGRLAERSTIRLGALLPLMKNSEPSAVKQIGNDVYDGVVLAVEEYETDLDTRIRVILETRDTDRDPAIAVDGVMQLCAYGDLVAIIGPVFSHTTSAVVVKVNDAKVPLVTPTANANGIAATGSYIFQANPDYENRGKAVASYAVRSKGFKTFAVLAPSDGNGKLLAEAFYAEVHRLGGRVVAREWYSPGTTDFSSQLQNIRKAGERASAEPVISFRGKLNQQDLVKFIQLGVPAKTLDSLVNKAATVPVSFLLGPRGVHIVDSLELTSVKYPHVSDSIDTEVTAIDALYLPIRASTEIGVISSQIVYFNIRTQLLGSGEWESLSELNASKRYCNGVIFESDSYPEQSGSLLTEFSEKFFQRFNRQSGKNALYGYDAARLILSLIKNGASNREALTRALSSVREYTGLHSNLSFSGRRVNSWLHILRYDSDNISMIEKVNVVTEGSR